MDALEPLDSLVIRCQRGDQEAFETLFSQFQPRLQFYVRRLSTPSDHGEDVLQEVWVKVIRKIKTLRDPRAFTAWLYQIARNEVLSKFRTKDPLKGLSDEPVDSLAAEEEPDFSQESATRVHEGLNRLKAHHREVLTLFFLEAMSYLQIAEVLDLPLGTIRSRLFHAKHSLRQALESTHG